MKPNKLGLEVLKGLDAIINILIVDALLVLILCKIQEYHRFHLVLKFLHISSKQENRKYMRDLTTRDAKIKKNMEE